MTGIPIPRMTGSMGVLLFFVLSGFLMAHLYLRTTPSKLEVFEYFRARFARIYPLFAVVCIASCAIFYLVSTSFPYKMSVLALAKHLLGVGPGVTLWTISTELQFYVLFGFMWLGYSRFPTTNRDSLFAATLVLIVGFMWLMGFSKDRIAITGYLHVFLMGMLAAIVLPYVKSKTAYSISAIAFPALFLVYIAACFIAPGTIGGRWVYHSMPLVIAMGGLVLAAVIANDSPVGRFFSSRPLLWLGEVSFGVYLLHRPAMWVMKETMPDNLPWYVSQAILLALVGIMAHLAYIYIEKPSRAYIRSIRVNEGRLAVVLRQ
jgi:peptidoglycan/LPS O-acetylase OafA/YrhL